MPWSKGMQHHVEFCLIFEVDRVYIWTYFWEVGIIDVLLLYSINKGIEVVGSIEVDNFNSLREALDDHLIDQKCFSSSDSSYYLHYISFVYKQIW